MSERPTGDSIAQKVHTRSATDNFADIARDLTDDHQHRPGLFQADLAKVNTELHARGILPGVDIVGVRGQDLVTRDSTGKVQVYDATNLSRHHDDTAANPSASIGDNGRVASLNPDGSGSYKIKQGDTTWSVAKDILKAQGDNNPSNNSIANYIKELEKANPGQKLDKLHPNDTINLPASTRGGDGTEFVGDRAEATASAARDATQKTHDEASAALVKFASAGTLFGHDLGNANITKDDVTKALAQPDLSDADRRGLTFIRDNYDSLAQHDGVFTPNGTVYVRGLDTWQQNQNAATEQTRITAYLNGN